MNDIAQFSALAALIIGGFGFFAFLFNRLEARVIKLEERIHELELALPREFQMLRRDLAEEFRAQRAEIAAQVTAIANVIVAVRKE